MKKLILPLLLVVSFLFAGFDKANAQTVTAASTTGMAPVSPAYLPSATATGLVLAGSTFTNTSGAAITLQYIDYSATVRPNTNFANANVQLWVNTSGTTFAGATQITTATWTGNSTADSYFTFAQSVPAGAAYTYFLVANYTTAGTNSTWTLTNTDFEDNNFNYYYPAATIARSYILTSGATASVTGTATSTSATAGSGGTSSPATISAAGTYTIQGTKIVASAAAAASKAITALNFTTSNASGNSYFYGTAYLFAGTAAGPTGSAIATLTTTAATTLNFTGLTGQYLTYGSTLYYYVEIVYSTVTASATTTLSLTSVTGPTMTYGAVAGPAYTFNPAPYALTLTSLTTTPGNNGLSTTPVAYGSTNYSVYGFQLLGGGGAGSTTINSLTFNQNGTSTDYNNLYYTTAYLYSNTTNTYSTGTKTLVATTTSTNSNSIVFTPGTAISATNTTNTYYFIVLSNTLGDNNALTFKLTYASSTIGSGTAITSGASVSGPAYTFAAQPKTTVTFNSIGASGTNPTNGLVANPISTFQTNMALEGFTLTGSGTGASETVTSITFARGDFDVENNNDFFPTLTLYSSTSATFPGVGGSGVSGPLGSVTLGANQNNFTITPTTALTVTSSTTPALYYFLVASYTTLGVYNGNTYEIDEAAVTTGSGAAATINNPYGYDYTFTAPTVTATDITAGLSPAPPASIYQGQSNLAVAGIGLSVSMGTTALTSLVFSDNQTKATAANYFSTPQLYVSSSPVFSLTGGTAATLVTTATATVATGGNITFAITGQNITTTPLYYYMVINYSVTGGTIPLTFQFAPSRYNVASNGGNVNTGFATNSYTCSPNIYVSTASLNGFPPTTLANSQVNIPIIGFSVASHNAATFSAFNFTTTESAGNIGTYFYNVRLYSSTTNDFTTATQVTDPGITISALTGANFSISGLTENISNSTVYYFVVVNYTAPNPGPQTFTPTLASVVTSSPTATTYSTAANGLTIVGQTYTMKTVLTYTYYWWGAGATTDWRDPANWTTATNLSGVNAGAYPGVFTTDNAVASYDYWQSGSTTQNATIGAYNIAITNFTETAASVNFNTASTFNLTVNSADSLSVASLNVGTTAATRASVLNILGSASGGVISSMRVTGATNLYNTATLTASTNGIINFPSGSSFNFNGTTNYNSQLTVAGGLINTNACNFSFSPNTTAYGGALSVSSGTLSVNGGTLTMNGVAPEIVVSGGTANFNRSTINVTGSQGGYLLGFGISGGTININGTSTSPAVINLGQATTNGINSEIQATGGNFNLGAYATLNINTVNSSGAYYNFYNSGGVITCASTSTINPSSSTAFIYNASASNYFTLLSDANGSATIGKFATGAKMTGQYNVQRYISTASRNYRLLTSATNTTNYLPGNAGSPNLIGVNYLGQSATVPTTPAVTYPGAFVGGPAGTGAGFTAATGGPCLYLYQESILPNPATFNTSYYSGKNVAVTGLGTYLSTTSSVVASGGSGTTASDNATNDVEVPPGNGYLLYYIGNNGNTTTSPLNATSVTNVGYINQGTVPLVMWGAGTLTSALTLNSGTPGSPDYPGLTMVGNPYPSSIDLKQLYTDNTTAGAIFTNGTYGFFNTLDPTTEQFDTYGYNGSSVTTSGSNASEYIASGQGFYATVVNANKTLTFYEDQKTASSPALVLESIPTNPLATVDNVSTGNHKIADALTIPVTSLTQPRILANALNASVILKKKNAADTSAHQNARISAVKLSPLVSTIDVPAATNTSPAVLGNTTLTPIAGLHLKFVVDSINNDQVGIYFTPTGSDKFESSDALDLDGQSNKVYLSSYTADDKRTSINSMGNYTGGKQVKLFAKAATAGIYQIQMTDIQNFDTNDYSVFLLDKLKADSLDLTLYKSYNFNYAPGTASDSTRFVLAIEHKPVPYYALLTFAGQKVTPGVQLNWQTKNLGNKTTFVLQKLTAGNVYVAIDSLQSDTSGEFNYIDQHPTLGNNTYRLEQINELGAITYSAPVTIGYNSTNPNGGLVLYPNPAKSTMTVTLTTSSTAVQVATADIYNAQGKLIEHKVVNSNSFVHDVSAYDLGVYIIQLKNSNGVIVGNSKFVKVN